VNALRLQEYVVLQRLVFNVTEGVRDTMPQTTLTLSTRGAGLYEFTDMARAFVDAATVDEGLLTVFVRHTSCSLLIQENADPDVRRDLDTFFRRLVPPADDPSMRWVVHTSEGPDDMPAHIKAALTQTSICIPVGGGRLLLGTWQGIYLFEHRARPHQREVVLHLGG
jgi:secondary thiamine-phosphate synthase enzyme